MGGIGDFLFGETNEGGLQGQASTLTGGQEGLLERLTAFLQGQVGQPAASFGQDTAAQASPLQNTAFGQVEDLLGSGVSQGAASSLNRINQPFDPSSVTDFFNTNVKAPALENFQDEIIPGIRQSFVNQGLGRSGAAVGALADAGTDLGTNLSRQLSDLLFNTEQRTLDRQAQTAPTGLNTLNTGLGAGGQQRDIMSQLLSGRFGEFLRTQPGNNSALNLLGPALGTRAFENIVQGPSQTEGALGPLTSLAGLFF